MLQQKFIDILSNCGIDFHKVQEVLSYDPQQPLIFSSGLFVFLFLAFSLVYVMLRKHTTARLLQDYGTDEEWQKP